MEIQASLKDMAQLKVCVRTLRGRAMSEVAGTYGTMSNFGAMVQ